jgi:hypothetical protein
LPAWKLTFASVKKLRNIALPRSVANKLVVDLRHFALGASKFKEPIPVRVWVLPPITEAYTDDRIRRYYFVLVELLQIV